MSIFDSVLPASALLIAAMGVTPARAAAGIELGNDLCSCAVAPAGKRASADYVIVVQDAVPSWQALDEEIGKRELQLFKAGEIPGPLPDKVPPTPQEELRQEKLQSIQRFNDDQRLQSEEKLLDIIERPQTTE